MMPWVLGPPIVPDLIPSGIAAAPLSALASTAAFLIAADVAAGLAARHPRSAGIGLVRARRIGASVGPRLAAVRAGLAVVRITCASHPSLLRIFPQ